MTAVSAINASSWANAVQHRHKTLLQRLGLGTACAIVLSPLLGWPYCAAWVIAYFALQLTELALFQPLVSGRAKRLPVWRELLGGFNILLNASIFAALVVPLWLDLGLVGGICAVLLLSAAAVHSTLGATHSSRMLYLGLVPHLVGLLATPLFLVALGASSHIVTTSVTAMGVFAYCCFTLWQRLHNLAERHEQALAEIFEQRQKFERLNASRNEFVATIGHDLRTPLGAILTGAAQFEQSAVDKSALAQAHMINDAGQLMKSLLDDLLDHAKIEAGHMDVEVSDFDLRSLLAGTYRLWKTPIHTRGLKFRLRGLRHVPSLVRGDPIRLRQILNNLISNALKFTQSGTITLGVTSWTDPSGKLALLFEVVDTGVGMSSAQMSRLFRPFDQTADGVSAQYGGTGLGLSISRQLAELMGGHLTARSVPGQGSRFTLSLMLDPSQEDAVGVQIPMQTAAPDWRIPSSSIASTETSAAPIAPAAAEVSDHQGASTEPMPADEGDDGQPLRILVVDDHEINRRALELILTPLGCRVSTAVDGMNALRQCDSDPFDLIFMDVRMPELDGRETTRRLRAGRTINAHVPVIAVTADSSREDVEKCLAAGMNHLVAKPITPEALLNALNKVMNNQPAVDATATTDATPEGKVPAVA